MLPISPNQESFCRIGSVLKPHGIDGSFVVFLDSDFPDWLAAEKVVYAETDRGHVPWQVLRARPYKETLILKVDALSDRSAVIAARGTALFVLETRARSANTDPEFFFNSDLVGMTVIDAVSGAPYGTIIEVLPSPAQDLLRIQTASGACFLFPFTAALIPSIDVANARMTVTMPEGLVDLN